MKLVTLAVDGWSVTFTWLTGVVVAERAAVYVLRVNLNLLLLHLWNADEYCIYKPRHGPNIGKSDLAGFQSSYGWLRGKM